MAFIGALAAVSALNTTLASGRSRSGSGGGLPPEPPRKRFQHLRDWWPVYLAPVAIVAVSLFLAWITS